MTLEVPVVLASSDSPERLPSDSEESMEDPSSPFEGLDRPTTRSPMA